MGNSFTKLYFFLHPIVKTVDLPTPEALVAFPNLNTSQHEIRWQVPKKMPKYPQKQEKDHKLSYR